MAYVGPFGYVRHGFEANDVLFSVLFSILDIIFVFPTMHMELVFLALIW